MDWLFVRVNLKKKRPYYLIFCCQTFMADMGEWSLGLAKKRCLFQQVGEGFVLWLTDVAFFPSHLSTVYDQSKDMLDGYRMQTFLIPEQRHNVAVML